MTAAIGFLPWQQAQAQSWLATPERFAHAWLIHGLPGVGQVEFAMAGAASLLCESPVQGLACDHCQACRWVRAGNHPDLRRIRPDAVAAQEGAAIDETEASGNKKQPSKDIRIEQIRSLLPWFNMATHRGGWRVALLYPAESLNTIAANALLKILEEPPTHTVFLLVADMPDRLLPTLVSRCRRLPLATPGADQALAWLQDQGVDQPGARLAAAGGAPLAALRQARLQQPALPDCVDQFLRQAGTTEASAPLADVLLASEPAQWLDSFQRIWLDLSLAARGLPVRYYPDRADKIQAIAEAADPALLARTGQWLAKQRRLAHHPLNPKLLADHAAQRLLQAVLPRQ
ncbi:DNA polymerase III subunit delta' [Castellaniella sp.]|uniref:DNA polymerase III subunit delta' n=1 Tax=Castellaniella sp. TaxID=1955812 RepID=UPI002B000B0B|nr:DNA polymerase III subunit delta' [Castellaniella sp.]